MSVGEGMRITEGEVQISDPTGADYINTSNQLGVEVTLPATVSGATVVNPHPGPIMVYVFIDSVCGALPIRVELNEVLLGTVPVGSLFGFHVPHKGHYILEFGIGATPTVHALTC